MANRTFSFHDSATLLAGATLVALLSGCVGDMPHRGAWGPAPNSVREPTAVVSVDEYLYYPAYGIYYNSTQHRYVRLESDGWSTRSELTGVSAENLLASPAVPMNFHDAPAEHHESVIRLYPKNWRPSGMALATGAGS